MDYRRPFQAIIGDRELGSAPASTIAGQMAHYRVYCIGKDGRFIKATDVVCGDDGSAILAAESMLGSDSIELWEHERKVAQFAGLGANASVADSARGLVP